jgi:hypothetical protein
LIEEYEYRPPIKYLVVGLGGILVSIIFGLAIEKDNIWFSIVMVLFGIMTLSMGIAFLTIFIRKFRIGNLIIGNDFIEIPGRWKKRIRLHFEDIIEIGEFDTYGNVFEIESNYGIHLIESNWMKQKDFENLKRKLKEFWTNDKE